MKNIKAANTYFYNLSVISVPEPVPVRALTTAGHDKKTCRKHLIASSEYVKKTYNYEGYGCGLCQVGVPCESRIPVRKAREAYEKGELPPPPPPLA